MKITKGDTVRILTGKDRGKTGVVARAFPKKFLVLVEGINMKKKHQKGTGGKKGTLVEKNYPIHVSNVQRVSAAKNEKSKKI